MIGLGDLGCKVGNYDLSTSFCRVSLLLEFVILSVGIFPDAWWGI